MLVSVIIPTFNRSRLLTRAIDSVLKQSYGNIEIIVVDDGSTDDTQLVVAKIAKRSNQLIYIKKNNGGCASARNRGLEIANGQLFAFLDSDDEWVPNAIETLARTLYESNAELVYSPSIEVYLDGTEEINYPVAAGQPKILAKEHFMVTNVRNGSYMFTRAAFEKVGRLDEDLRYNEDSDYLQRLAIHCEAVYSPNHTVRVYNHNNSKSRNRTAIYKALLKSSQKMLAENPIFAAQLGVAADIRIGQIKTQLVEALISSGNFAEANSVARDIFSSLRLNVKIALLVKNNIFIILRNHLRRFSRHLTTLLR